MYNPVSTYRFQFNSQFTLDHFRALLPYLRALGITTIYASPLFRATPQSSHGYDGVDPTHINPEIGTVEQLRAISQELRQAGMGWFQDIVPNHLAYHPDNEWLMDVLEKGPLSRYAHFFETSLSSSFFRGRMEAPFLPGPLEETIGNHALTLDYEEERLVLKVQGNTLPLKPGSYAAVLRAGDGEPNEAVAQLLDLLDQLRHNDEPESYAVAWDEFRQQLTALMKNEATAVYIRSALDNVNRSPELLGALAIEQHYRFCTEPETRREMNYRRFFTINGLICLNMREEPVFRAYHQLTKELVDEGVFQGLRIDHVDGLFDPKQYLERLRELTGPETCLIVEKILQGNEDLPNDWPIEGASGYEFLALVNNVLTDRQSEPAFQAFYQRLVGNQAPIHAQIEDRKRFFLAQYMGGERSNLHHYFESLNLTDESRLAGLSVGQLAQTIGEVLVRCPVYRYYGNRMPLPDADANALRSMLDSLRDSEPDLAAAVAVLEEALLTKPQAGAADYNGRALRFYQRLMQFSSPLMAKGVEDTLLYTYNRFLGHNEVGDSPERFGMAPDDFHRAMQHRQQHWPLALNASSTHDTKRGEDVRARLNVLTALPDEWLAEVQQWQQLTRSGEAGDQTGQPVPDPNDEYFMYQTLLGAYPMPDQDEDDFPNRFRLYMEKALQEAKRHTAGWAVEETYHEKVRRFIDRLFYRSGAFWARFQTFYRPIADYGVANSLVQTVLKCTCPGVPDVYQGSENWDLSLVDPDNRRPVHFERFQPALADLVSREQAGDGTLWADLWQNRFDGRVKLWLTRCLLRERQQNPAVFWQGQYIPLSVEGALRDYVLAFARQHESVWYVVIVPLHAARLCRGQDRDVLTLDWQDTRVRLPADAPTAWTDCLTSAAGDGADGVALQPLFGQLPLALLRLSA